MRFVIIEGVVLNTDAIAMVVPHGAQSEVSLQGGATRVFNLPVEELLEHLRYAGDEIIRIQHERKLDAIDEAPAHGNEEIA